MLTVAHEAGALSSPGLALFPVATGDRGTRAAVRLLGWTATAPGTVGLPRSSHLRACPSPQVLGCHSVVLV